MLRKRAGEEQPFPRAESASRPVDEDVPGAAPRKARVVLREAQAQVRAVPVDTGARAEMENRADRLLELLSAVAGACPFPAATAEPSGSAAAEGGTTA
jgi:hypothetical protein